MIAKTKELPDLTADQKHSVSSLVCRFIVICQRIPNSLVALLARFSIASVFWKSGETKIQAFAIDLVNREFTLGWPRLSDSAIALFKE